MKEKTMHGKLLSGEITYKQYMDFIFQRKGYNDYNHYQKLYRLNTGYKHYQYTHENSKRVLKYQHTLKGFLVLKKHKAKRYKELGYDVINEDKVMEKGFVGHHINKRYVLFIPLEIHNSIRHNVFTGKNMEVINEQAIGWYTNNYLSCHVINNPTK